MTTAPQDNQTVQDALSVLDSIRTQIDALDTRIHDTLMERAALIAAVGKEEAAAGIDIVQPAREADMIRRLLDRHEGDLPAMAVVRIWRELVGAVSLLQTGLKVVVCTEKPIDRAEDKTVSAQKIRDMAKDYFGSCLPMDTLGSVEDTLFMLERRKADLAVLPMPMGQPFDAAAPVWWEQINKDKSKSDPLYIQACLPHGFDPALKDKVPQALIIGRTPFRASAEDRSFLRLYLDHNISRETIHNAALDSRLKPVRFTTRNDRTNRQDGTRPHLLEVEGFIDTHTPALRHFSDMLKAQSEIYCLVEPLGGYPVPVTYPKTVVPLSL